MNFFIGKFTLSAEFREMPPAVVELLLRRDISRAGAAVEAVDELKQGAL